MAYGQKLRNQLRRARRDILIAREGWKPDHAELVEQYIRSRPFAPGTRHLFRHIGPYVEAGPDALLFAARDCEGALQGFIDFRGFFYTNTRNSARFGNAGKVGVV